MNKKAASEIIAGILVYAVTSYLLPTWSHLLAALLGCGIYLATYYLLPPKLKYYIRDLISIAVTILIVFLVRVIF